MACQIRAAAGQAMKIVATARSDEHVFNLEGGRGTKTGRRHDRRAVTRSIPTGQPHSAFIGVETVAYIVYTGEPDEIVSLEVVDPA